jgi:hypothetical protein
VPKNLHVLLGCSSDFRATWWCRRCTWASKCKKFSRFPVTLHMPAHVWSIKCR